MQKKKKWVKPQLIVLVRGKSEERVLQICKLTGFFSGPDIAYTTCGRLFEETCIAIFCDTLGPS